MKNADKQFDHTFLEGKISAKIKEIAVENGLRSPVTQEEVALFEERFAQEIQKANLNPPPIDEILALAGHIKASDKPVLTPKASAPAEHPYAMAARNGKEITSEIEDLMEEELRKVKSKKKIDE